MYVSTIARVNVTDNCAPLNSNIVDTIALQVANAFNKFKRKSVQY